MSSLININSEDGGILLPLEDKKLASFISSLLGQPQSIEKIFTDSYVADYQYFINLIDLIIQRLDQQNQYSIVSFQATIGYKDKTKRKVSTIEAFKGFSETKNLVSTDLNLKLGILVNFPRKDIPEKQEIDMYFATSLSANGTYARNMFDVALKTQNELTGVVSVEINHTERTWADDMLTLIENSFDDIWVKETTIKKIGRILTSILKMQYMYVPIFILIFIYMSVPQKTDIKDLTYSNYLDISNKYPTGIESLHHKIDFMAYKFFNRPEIDFWYMAYRFGKIMLVIVILICLVSVLKSYLQPPTSFIILTNKTKSYMETLDKNRSYKLWFLSLAGTIIIGLFINYLFSIFN
ncbi:MULTISPECIES: hypothetical protein [Psychrobacter]|uniref:hypothetical protein n=1 Tax=Psychrobacter TaxID=497 RepID=UPI00097E848E|nr:MULTISPECIES: hypothetical protein [Psychrobacter]SJN37717.1 hypothetical protein CZ794_09965 [Psychrobacter sp. JB385]